MPIDADLSQLPVLVRIAVTGVYPSLEERSAFRRQLAWTNGFTPHTVALIDLKGITSIPPSVTASHGRRNWMTRRAYIADLGTVAYGLARQAQAQAKPPEAIGVFYDETEAVAWLLSGAPSQDSTLDLPSDAPSVRILPWRPRPSS